MALGRRLIAASIACALLGACGGAATKDDGGTGRDAGTTVSISGFLFKPEKLSVHLGSTVTWRNHDDIAHTVTAGTPEAPSATFDSGDRIKDQTFDHTFEEAGTFTYFCKNHNGMRGEIDVA